MDVISVPQNTVMDLINVPHMFIMDLNNVPQNIVMNLNNDLKSYELVVKLSLVTLFHFTYDVFLMRSLLLGVLI